MRRPRFTRNRVLLGAGALSLVAAVLFILMPTAFHQETGWTGIEVYGDQTGRPPSCPASVVDSSNHHYPPQLVQQGDETWTRWYLGPGVYQLSGANVDPRSITVIPAFHYVVNSTHLVGCVSDTLNMN